MIHTEIIQGSEAWFDYKLAKISASSVIETKPSRKAGRANYMAKLAAEKTTGQRIETFKNDSMDHGTETEAEARAAYEMHTERLVKECGFIDHPEIKNAGASPDGIIYDGDKLIGGIEIKCPNTTTHIDTLKNGIIKTEYIWQMHFCMMCADVQWWDFISFDNRLPANCQLYIKRVERDPELCKEIESLVTVFKAELTEMINFIRGYNA